MKGAKQGKTYLKLNNKNFATTAWFFRTNLRKSLFPNNRVQSYSVHHTHREPVGRAETRYLRSGSAPPAILFGPESSPSPPGNARFVPSGMLFGLPLSGRPPVRGFIVGIPPTAGPEAGVAVPSFAAI